MSATESGTLHHICFVVDDLERAAREMADRLGIGPWGVWTIEPEECTVHGRSARMSFRIAIAEVGSAAYELLEPVAGDNVYVEHLRSKGPGFHHTCLAYESLEAMRGAKAELMQQGREMLQSGSLGELGEFCYFDVPETGSILELLFLTELPPPEMTIG